jgi:alkylation response protein AidB-like acyl-CoA dehydrogenase
VSGPLDLSDEERALADVAGRCVTDSVDLIARARGEAGAPDLERRMVQLGVPSLMLSADQGGSGLGLFGLMLVAEALGREAAASGTLAGALAAHLVETAGSTGRRARWLEGLGSGALTAAFALHEGGEAWAPGAWRLAGERLTGTKTNLDAPAAPDLFIVGLLGGGLTLVEPGEGVSLAPLDALDASRRLHALRLDAAPHEPLHGEGLGERLFTALLVLSAAEAWAAADRALSMTVDYALTRRQFGRPIGAFQAIKHQLADMAAEIAPARFLAWRAARAWDAAAPEAARWAALAKAHVTSVAVRACRTAVRAHGGVGYTADYPLHLFLKKAMHAYADHGAPALHRARAAELAGWGARHD